MAKTSLKGFDDDGPQVHRVDRRCMCDTHHEEKKAFSEAVRSDKLPRSRNRTGIGWPMRASSPDLLMVFYNRAPRTGPFGVIAQ